MDCVLVIINLFLNSLNAADKNSESYKDKYLYSSDQHAQRQEMSIRMLEDLLGTDSEEF